MMKNTNKTLVGVLSMIAAFVRSFSGPLLVKAATSTLDLQITAGGLSISSPSSFSFGTLSTSFNAQTITTEFSGTSNYFVVQDLLGADSGYSTTLQISGDLVAGSYAISGANLEFKSSSASVALLSGLTNPRVLIDSNTSSYQALNTSKTYIYRNAQSNTGVIGKYGQSIRLQLTVPANQAPGSYQGTLVYTVISN